jgi:hypothetical protein
MLCLRCRFDLAGSRDAGRCPECGRAFDAADRLSWAEDRGEPLRRRLAGPPGWPLWLLAIAVALLVLRAGFGPGSMVNRTLDALLAFTVLSLVLSGRAAIGLSIRRTVPTGSFRRGAWRWAGPVAPVAAALVANIAGLTRAASFALQRGGLERLAAGPATPPGVAIAAPLVLGAVRDGFILLDAPIDGGTLARLAVLPIANTGYDSADGAWCLAPGAPDSFRWVNPGPYREWRFERYRGDWYVGR